MSKIETKQDKDPMAWEVLDSEYVFKRPWLTARRDHVKLPTGAEINDFYVLEYPDFCNVVAITKDNKFLMECQIATLSTSPPSRYRPDAWRRAKYRWRQPNANCMRNQVMAGANGRSS